MNSGMFFRRDRRVDRDDVRNANQPGHWRDVACKVVGQIGIQRGVDRIRRGDDEDCVSVWRRFDDEFGGDVAARAGAVLDHEILAESFGQRLRHDTRPSGSLLMSVIKVGVSSFSETV